MGHLEDVSVDRLQRALDAVEGSTATQRLTAAIAYKHGVTQTELAEWYGVQRRTIYSWLTRLESAPPEEAAADGDRGGRPRKLSGSQQDRLEATLLDPPTEAGYDAPAWTPALVRQYLDDQFDVSYSLPSCRRLMREAGLRYRKPHRVPGADEGEESPSTGGGRWTPR
jgi:transposase